ncbi:MAG: serine/threonine protein kinase, partial [Gemmatimonadaceae bacterium]|nr:serine/threonine protein kinase [Gemmatimonadaceae bacterium]
MPPALDPTLRDLPTALAGEFELEQELGRGGMGVVFRARDVRLDREVAIKVLPPERAADAETRTRFLREARTAGQLSHPHIVHIHRADERGAYAFFVMGLVDGETLAQRVRDRGPLPPADAVRHLREVAWALAYAHARGVVHRDVKPENIMIERGTNRALVTDFGIARIERASSLTSEGLVVGTAHYMSPEQVQGQAVDGRADLYSLGVVGYYLLSGRLPFEGDAASAVLVAHVTRPAPPLASVAPRVPRALATVIDRCLAKDPAQRFATGEDLAEALRRAMEGAITAKEPVVSGGHRLLNEDQAALVWRRAAQLQAEA